GAVHLSARNRLPGPALGSLHGAVRLLRNTAIVATSAAASGRPLFLPRGRLPWEHGACLRKSSATGAPRRRSSRARTGGRRAIPCNCCCPASRTTLRH